MRRLNLHYVTFTKLFFRKDIRFTNVVSNIKHLVELAVVF